MDMIASEAVASQAPQRLLTDTLHSRRLGIILHTILKRCLFYFYYYYEGRGGLPVGEGPSLHILSRQPAERKPDFKLHLSSAVSKNSLYGVTWKTITSIQQEEISVAEKKLVGDKKIYENRRSRD